MDIDDILLPALWKNSSTGGSSELHRYELHCRDLVLHVDGSQSLVDLMEDPLALEAAASAVQTGHDDAVGAHQHRVPTEVETVAHRLSTGGAVTAQGTEGNTKRS